MSIPEELLRDCPETYVEIRVNGDLVTKIGALRGDLDNCNAEKRQISSFIKDVGGR